MGDQQRVVVAKVAELDATGFTVLDGLVEPAKLEAMREEFLRMLGPVRRRDRNKLHTFTIPAGASPGQAFDVVASPQAGRPTGETVRVQVPEGGRAGDTLDVPAGADREHGPIDEGHGGLQETERYTMHLPWRLPFADPTVYEHPLLLNLLGQFWGTDDFRITCMHSNCPFPGARFQRWHRDGGGLSEQTQGQLPSGRNPALGVVIPLCTTSEANGAMELIPGSHVLPDYYSSDKQQNDVLFNQRLLLRSSATATGFESAAAAQTDGAAAATTASSGMDARTVELAPPRRMAVQAGAIWLRDARCLHRGTPNRSPQPRPEIILCYAKGRGDPTDHRSPTLMGRPYDYYFQHGGITAEQYAGLRLSQRGEKLLGWARPGQGPYDKETGVVTSVGRLGVFSRL
eukprot:COSAG05_NODE_1895_length_3875_cov_8.440943_4_plen_401_part_00